MNIDLELCHVVADSVDRLTTSQIFMSGGGADPTVRNINADLYNAAVRVQGGPLSFLATKGLIERVKPRDVVVICAGFFDPPAMITEADGPVGAALLGRALAAGLGATPVFLTEVTNMPRMAELVRATGLEVVDVDLARTTAFKAAIAPLPIDDGNARRLAPELMRDLNPAAMVCIEKPSPSDKGTFHVGSGVDVSSLVGKVQHYVHAARDAGVFTIGIGDGGNEAGMGRIHSDVCEIVSTGKIIGTVLETDVLIVSAIANWGAYAIEACLAAALHLPEVLHPTAVERRVMDAAARTGMIDPMSGLAQGWVDGTPPICSESLLELLRCIVELRLDLKTRPQTLARNGYRWHHADDRDHQIAVWAKALAAEEEAFFKRG
ncbi:MAG: DUF4392 domain-containing protein [Pigmentiphaga sp.]|nr:DUF4392 domain-containing protein [Pigmentiphaga sp.]